MDGSIGDLLKARDYTPPDEIARIKQFVLANFKADCSVDIRDEALIIGVGNGSFASALRMQIPKLREAIGTDKKLIIKIK